MNTIKCISIALIAVTTNLYADVLSEPTYSAADTSIKIREITDASKPGKSFAATSVMHSRLDHICHTLLNYSEYPDFMPNVDEVQLSMVNEASAVLDMKLKLPLNTIKKYRLRMQQSADATHCKISWKLIPLASLKVSETIADTEGYWLVTAIQSNNQAALVRYVAYTDPGDVPVGMGWIVDKLSKDGIPKTVEAVRLRAQKLSTQ